ncbi:hypothetical protein [Acinetobacter sp. HR7]|uniref:hypothetical protein n=1 Tax=Acinetobacter sp. HR7 TaxID=1509403 RepID=UPI000538AD63|nr:hypothetical protein [Acinetobacter sp. HR7]KGT48403.1 hypothetical protein GW12_05540 [Acinetobacter sp. HR7]
MNTQQKFSQFIDAFKHTDSDFVTCACERYRVGIEYPKMYLLKRRNGPETHTEGNIAGFEVYRVHDGRWTLIPLAKQNPWLVNALNIARAPRVADQKRVASARRAQFRSELSKSGFYQTKEYKDWARKHGPKGGR